MSAISLAEGSVFAERYRIVRCIATGGMGAVYEVTHLETERRRALKVMHPHLLQSDELRERFRQEARVAAHVESEFIVDVFDAGIDAPTQMPFLVMELLRGDEVGQLLKKRGCFSPVEVVTYLHQTALALDRTHRAMIVHRDLKPENLFLTLREDGPPRIKVLDFGIAKVIAESATNAQATRSLGTPLYMAPEQFRLGHKVSSATDLYALGMMAYTLLVGKAFWSEEALAGSNIFAFATAVMNGPQERGTERARRAGKPLPPAFDMWFAQATALEPEQRFRSASALVAGLAGALGVPGPSAGFSDVHGVVPAPSNSGGPGNAGPISQRSGATSAPGRAGGTARMAAPAPGMIDAIEPPEEATAVLSRTTGSPAPVVITHGPGGAVPVTRRSHRGLAAGIGVGLLSIVAVGMAAFLVMPTRAPIEAASAAPPVAFNPAVAPVPSPAATSTDVAPGTASPTVVPSVIAEVVPPAPIVKPPIIEAELINPVAPAPSARARPKDKRYVRD